MSGTNPNLNPVTTWGVRSSGLCIPKFWNTLTVSLKALDWTIGTGGDDTERVQAVFDKYTGELEFLVPQDMQVNTRGFFFKSLFQLADEGLIFLMGGSNTHVFQGNALGVSNVHFRGKGTIDGNQANNPIFGLVDPLNAGTAGIVTGRLSDPANLNNRTGIINYDVSVEEILFQNVRNWPVSLFNTDGADILRCRCKSNRNALQVCVSTNFRMNFNRVKNCPDFGIAAYEGCSFGEMLSNNLDSCASLGILNDGADDPTACHDITIAGNRHTNATAYGIGVHNSTNFRDADIYNINIFGNELINPGTTQTDGNSAGIVLINVNNSKVIGNFVSGGGCAGFPFYGIGGGGTSSYLTIENNTIANAGANGASKAVAFGTSFSQTSWKNNTTYDNQAVPTTTNGFGFGENTANGMFPPGCSVIMNTFEGLTGNVFDIAVPFPTGTDTQFIGQIQGGSSAITIVNLATIQGVLDVFGGPLNVVGPTGGNNLAINGAASGSPVSLAPFGTDASIGLTLQALNNGPLTLGSTNITIPGFHSWPSYANDAAAATGGVAIDHAYRNGSTMSFRVT